MAATLAAVVSNENAGSQMKSKITLTGDASYPTGGYAVAASDFGFRLNIEDVIVAPKTLATGVAYGWYDLSTGKVKLYTTAGAEVANATNVATVVLELTGFGN